MRMGRGGLGKRKLFSNCLFALVSKLPPAALTFWTFMPGFAATSLLPPRISLVFARSLSWM